MTIIINSAMYRHKLLKFKIYYLENIAIKMVNVKKYCIRISLITTTNNLLYYLNNVAGDYNV